MAGLPDTMLEAYLTELGGPERIRIGPLSVPVPGPTDVLVRTELIAVNHVDTFVRSGGYATHTPFPFVIGRDLVGSVVRAGEGVDEFAIGEKVWCNSLGHRGRQGSFAEFAVVPRERLYRLRRRPTRRSPPPYCTPRRPRTSACSGPAPCGPVRRSSSPGRRAGSGVRPYSLRWRGVLASLPRRQRTSTGAAGAALTC
ncbi:alcohol dehydrogenase catalytic domain-containing protein [Micromonospora sp. ATA51]|nr:alcohol dehydrogenase catalytic domain-containing protein [Micromonospora sp. ATA51]